MINWIKDYRRRILVSLVGEGNPGEGNPGGKENSEENSVSVLISTLKRRKLGVSSHFDPQNEN